MDRLSIKEMTIEHVLNRDSGEDWIQPDGSLRQPGRQGREPGLKTFRQWVIIAPSPEGVATAFGARKLLLLLKNPAAAHSLVQLPGALAHGSLVSLSQHHPFSPAQNRGNIARTATELPANGLPTLAATVKTDVVLVEIRGAWHHDQCSW